MGSIANKEKAYEQYFANKYDEAIKIFNELIKENPLISERIEIVKASRLLSKKANTNLLAKTPYKFEFDSNIFWPSQTRHFNSLLISIISSDRFSLYKSFAFTNVIDIR